METFALSIIEFIILGISIGTLSSFLGIGGGTILVPILIFLGIPIKDAISISVLQMFFSSIFATYLSFKNSFNDIKNTLYIGVGGFIGAMNSHFIIDYFSPFTLKLLFLFFVFFALYRLSIAKINNNNIKNIKNDYKDNKLLLFILGFFIGLIAISLGVGGSIMLTPILVGYFFYDMKQASAIGLSFVIFSSLSGVVSFTYLNLIPFEALYLAGGSLFGVFLGLKLKEIISLKDYKKILLSMYIIIAILTIYNLFK